MSDSNHNEQGQQSERERIIGRMQQEEAIMWEYGTGNGAREGSAESTGAPDKSIQRKPWRGIQVWKGIGLVALLHLMLVFIPVAYLIIGLVQWLYIIPVMLLNRQDPALLRGILIASGATFVLNAVWLAVALGAFG